MLEIVSAGVMRRSNRNFNITSTRANIGYLTTFCARGVGNLTCVLAGWAKLNRNCKVPWPRRDFRLRTSDFGLPTSDFRLRTSDFYRSREGTSDFRFQTSDFRLRTSDFRLRTSDFGLRTSDFDFGLLTSDFRLFGKDILERIFWKEISVTVMNLCTLFPSVYMNTAVELSNSSYRQGNKLIEQQEKKGEKSKRRLRKTWIENKEHFISRGKKVESWQFYTACVTHTKFHVSIRGFKEVCVTQSNTIIKATFSVREFPTITNGWKWNFTALVP